MSRPWQWGDGARSEALAADKALLLAALHVALRHADGTLAEVDAETRRLELAGCQVILDQFAYAADDASRPKRHEPASSFGYAYCAVCKADWPCHTAKGYTETQP